MGKGLRTMKRAMWALVNLLNGVSGGRRHHIGFLSLLCPCTSGSGAVADSEPSQSHRGVF